MSQLDAPSIVLMGPPGSGKTYSLVTLLQAGIEVFLLVLEPNGLDTILDAISKHEKADELLDRFHYHRVGLQTQGWQAFADKANNIGSFSFAELSKLNDKNKSADSYMELLRACNNFKCDRTGKEYGDISTWDDTRAVVVDSLSGINRITRFTAIGYKSTPSQNEWGVMMNLEDDLIYKLCSDLHCYFVLIAHVNKFRNEITGDTSISPRAITNNQGNAVGVNFSEVVLAKRFKDTFVWSTSETIVDVKNRALPISDSLPPDFGPIVAAHTRRVAMTKDSSK